MLLVLLLVMLLAAACNGGEFSLPGLRIGLSANLPLPAGVSYSLELGWTNADVSLEWRCSGSGLPPLLTAETNLWNTHVGVSGRLQTIEAEPRVSVELLMQRTEGSIALGMSWKPNGERLLLDAPYARLVVRPASGIELSGSGRLTSKGLDASRIALSWEPRADVLVGFELKRIAEAITRSTYSFASSTIGLGIEHSVTRAPNRVERSSKWYAVAPSSRGAADAVASNEDWAAASLQEVAPVHPTIELETTGDYCCTTPVSAASECIGDFGDVLVGESSDGTVRLPCNSGAFCWLDEITHAPAAPFRIFYSPGRLTIPWGQADDIEITFSPTQPGVFVDRLEIVFCHAYWVCEEEEVFLGGGLNEIRWRYTYRCVRGTCEVRGVGIGQPTAVCSYSPANPVCGKSVSFSSRGSSDPNPEGFIDGYSWNFGDGSTSTDANPTHRFRRAGPHRVTLVVRNNRGLSSDPATCTVDVLPDLVETSVVAGAAVASGVAAHVAVAAPPLLSAAAPGFVLAGAAMIAIGEACRFLSDQLIVHLASSFSEEDARALIARVMPGCRIIGYFSLLNTYLIRVPDRDTSTGVQRSLEDWRQELVDALPEGAWVLRNYMGEFEGIARGSRVGTPDQRSLPADMTAAYDTVCAEAAWECLADSQVRLRPVRIAVVDTGIDADHEEFSINLRGRSYVQDDSDAVLPWSVDPLRHGTRVCGIIGAENGTGRMNGILGGAVETYEMQVYRVIGDLFSFWDSLRIAISDADQELEVWGAAAEESQRRQAVVINASLGWDLARLDDATRLLVEECFLEIFSQHQEILFVTSAGNGEDPTNLEQSEGLQLATGGGIHAPGGVAAPNNLTVAATNTHGNDLMSWSNYGSAVEIAAPGKDVYTTDSDGTYVWRIQGTSYAAALVSGAAATVLAVDPRLSPGEVKEILTSSPRRVRTPDGRSIPVLDVHDAVRKAIESRLQRDRRALWTAVGAGVGAIILGFLLLRPF